MSRVLEQYRDRRERLRFWMGEAERFLERRQAGDRCPAYLRDLLRRSLTNFIYTRKYLCGLRRPALERQAVDLLRELIQ